MQRLITALILTCLCTTPALAANYTLTIDGKAYDLDLDREAVLRLSEKQELRVTLSQKAVVNFTTEHISFDHPGNLAPSRTDLGDGVFQTMLASPRGTLVMIQEFTTLDPSPFIDLMLSELTKEELQSGYKVTNSLATQKLAGGEIMSGKLSVSTSAEDEYTRQVLSYGGKESGVLVVTQIEAEGTAEDKAMLETFWKSLKVSFK